MKVLVFGASGATGRLLVDEAVRAGHAVAAFVREPAKLGSPSSAPRLTNGPKTCAYRHGEHIHARQFVPRISRADVAHFMVNQLTDTTYIHHAPALMP